MMIDLAIETEAELCGLVRVVCLRSFESRGLNAALTIEALIRELWCVDMGCGERDT